MAKSSEAGRPLILLVQNAESYVVAHDWLEVLKETGYLNSLLTTLDKARPGPYDLVILFEVDVDLERANTTIRHLERLYQGRPIIVMTAHNKQRRIVAFAASNIAVLSKPVERAVFLNTVARFVDRDPV